MRRNGKKEVELGHVLGRLAFGAEFEMGGNSYKVLHTSDFPGILGDRFLLGYTVLREGLNPVVEHLSPYSRVLSVEVTKRVFPKDVGLFEVLHANLVDRGWH